ncbi:uncharacterized protein LOC111698145 isoform X2 [Eurytemora carolleeae]|uniref:uncharacterized protein LOC111698145 isoform X2 n=1 Tax=Eurytemora carolleeae TaxID=1294199 RepID=UPI000C78DB7E|nr:uncharacterized protein LOC111698145 isoform X2 [Eurytemora carolleeae]|eukprot:XP_023324173.1 uncharacterized protein LOC111698145 isoform X2 [Eurytemora affinis]
MRDRIISNMKIMMIPNMMMMMNIYAIILLLLVYISSVSSKVDYWSEDYDSAKNCKDEGLILAIRQNKTKGFCEEATGDLTEDKVFENCKLNMAKTLGSLCTLTTVDEAGELLYCKNNLHTVCCSRNYSCTSNWNTISDNFIDVAVSFLKDQKKYLAEEKKKGYESCHSLNSSLDASICQQDCTKYEESDFAKKCKKDEGYFKCCVRRDKANCHECRFCCTLLMCTLRIGGNETYTAFSTYEMVSNTTVQDSRTENEIKAKENFYLPSHMYKQPDYRCLNPDSNEDPTKWGAYNPNQFANALSKEEQEQVTTYPFDNRFLNFEDPEVLKYMTGKNKTQKWREVYGYDFASKLGDTSDVLKNCIKAESSKFAKKCKKSGGLFKCCSAKWTLSTYNSARKRLKELKLIKSYDEDTCKDDKCFISTNLHICSVRDKFSGLTSLKFKTPLENPLGGATIHNAEKEYKLISNNSDLKLGYRGTFCQYLDTCAPEPTTFEEIGKFMHAYDKDTFCDLKDKNVVTNKTYKSDETKEECKKRKFPNIRVCPKKKFYEKDPDKDKPSVRLYEGAMKLLWGEEREFKKKKKESTSKEEEQDEKIEKSSEQEKKEVGTFREKKVDIIKQRGSKRKNRKRKERKKEKKRREAKNSRKEKEENKYSLIAATIKKLFESM